MEDADYSLPNTSTEDKVPHDLNSHEGLPAEMESDSCAAGATIEPPPVQNDGAVTEGLKDVRPEPALITFGSILAPLVPAAMVVNVASEQISLEETPAKTEFEKIYQKA